MGGKGSGRHAEIREQRNPIATGIFLPNLSGAKRHQEISQNFLYIDGSNANQDINIGAYGFLGDTITLSSQSSCRVYLSSDQTISTNSITLVHFDTESYDTQSEYDNASTYLFTAKEAGKYLITSNVSIIALADTDYGAIYVYKNGSAVAKSSQKVGGAGDATLTISTIVSLAVNDTIGVYVFHLHGSNRDIDGGGEHLTNMCVHKLT